MEVLDAQRQNYCLPKPGPDERTQIALSSLVTIPTPRPYESTSTISGCPGKQPSEGLSALPLPDCRKQLLIPPRKRQLQLPWQTGFGLICCPRGSKEASVMT